LRSGENFSSFDFVRQLGFSCCLQSGFGEQNGHTNAQPHMSDLPWPHAEPLANRAMAIQRYGEHAPRKSASIQSARLREIWQEL
tara:strand:- start:3315 stop:3566 length:252 start_codon:yes stop_codon:yes gene_type:complete